MLRLRITYLWMALGALALILIALFMQYGMDLVPCALCITQRVFIIGIGVVALIAGIHNPRGWGRWVYALFGWLFAGLGAATAGRQLWLQSLPPDQVPACGPSLDYILDSTMQGGYPISQALTVLLQGDGNCAEVAWRFLGLSIPGWTLLAFIAFAAVFLWQALRRPL